ncbi:MAG TPA: hypothetical protein VMP01_15665 [Pirellulaceae bacterium]|nr:hypothetical protein [Pirellulaceae bacterium]
MRLFDGKKESQSTGAILAPQRYDDIGNIHFRALTLCFRPLDPGFNGGAELSDYELVSTDETVDGRPCMLLRDRKAASASGIVHLLHVDPARDFVVLRYTSEVQGRLAAQIDITYTEDPTVRWVPDGWNAVLLRQDGVVMTRCSSTVSDYALNERLSEKLFVIDFPPGTFVDDRASGTEYLVRQGGEKRSIAPVERRRGVTWEQLMETEYGKAGLRSEGWSARTLTLAIGGFAALCVIVFFMRRPLISLWTAASH